jgi:hypothetical protein
MFIDGLIVLSVAGVALVMETHIERVSDLALLPMRPSEQSKSSLRIPYWLDIAVLQLAFGAGVVPLLLHFPALQEVGWRLVTITIVSEFVYLAFLSAQLVQKNELIALFAAIRKAKEDIKAPRAESGVSEDEWLTQKKEREVNLKLLQDRAEALMQQVGRALATAERSERSL